MRILRPHKKAADECDHSFELVRLNKLLPYFALFAAMEQDALRENDGASAGLGIHGFHQMLEPCKVRV